MSVAKSKPTESQKKKKDNPVNQSKLEIDGRFWKLAAYPSPNLTFCPKKEVSANVRLGEGWVGSFPEAIIDPKFGAKCGKTYASEPRIPRLVGTDIHTDSN